LIGDIEQEVKNKKDELFAKLFGNKENSQPNFIVDKPGRYSLQPQPIGSLKLPETTTTMQTIDSGDKP
jgi:hypothetical protein